MSRTIDAEVQLLLRDIVDFVNEADLLLKGYVYRTLLAQMHADVRDIATDPRVSEFKKRRQLKRPRKRLQKIKTEVFKMHQPEQRKPAKVETKRKPPVNARFILHLWLSDVEREIVDSTLEELFEHDLERFGQRRAELLYYKRVGKSIWPYVKRWLYKVGLLAWITDLARRLIG